jgi:transposase
MAFIRKVKTSSGATAVQIAYKSSGRIVKIEHIGSAHTEKDLKLLLTIAQNQLLRGQMDLFPEKQSPLVIQLVQSVSRLLFDALYDQYRSLGFDHINDTIFAYLCIARLVEPTSKLDSVRVLSELGIDGITKDQIYRCLKQIISQDYRGSIAKHCFTKANTVGIRFVLYDVTTLYFEVQEEDEYRKSGMSKERRLEPQIIIGLLVNQYGFPLSVHSFEGNTAETNTILPVIEAFKQQHNLSDITVVADAGMLSRKNLDALTSVGYTFIVGSKMQKIPYDIAQYQKEGVLADKQIITTMLPEGQRIIYQYRDKRAALDRRNIEKQIQKAERILTGKLADKRAKFLTITTREKKLNQTLIDKAKALVGIKGYVTNLPLPDDEVIQYYHQLWHVEQSFRMSKSDLKARPIFHHKRESIEAHLTIVFTALAIGKTIEQKTNMSIKKFIRMFRSIRSGIVSINGENYRAEAKISTEAKEILKKLHSGH